MPRRPEPWAIKQRRGYWYYKIGGGPYRSTGIPIGNWKRSKPQAERYAQEHAGMSQSAAGYQTVKEYADRYFMPATCPWFTREHGRGNHISETVRHDHRSRLEAHILPVFGHLRFEDLSPVAIEHWLYHLDYATQTKKHLRRTFGIVLNDMRRDRLISFDERDIQTPVVRHAEKEIPTDGEAAKLFPADTAEFRKLWGRRFPMGVLLAVAYSSGMRISELRALAPAAVKWDLSGVVVVVTINRDGETAPPKAKSVRAIPLPRWTLDLMRELKTIKAGGTAGAYVFPGRGSRGHLELSSANHSLHVMTARLGIPKKITPHGLRHGYNTRMRSLLSAAGMGQFFDTASGFRATTTATDAVLRAFTGHRSPNMTELYDHPDLLAQLKFFDEHFREVVDGYWDFRKTQLTGGNDE